MKSVTASNQRAACISPICYTKRNGRKTSAGEERNLIDFLKLHKQTLWIGKKGKREEEEE